VTANSHCFVLLEERSQKIDQAHVWAESPPRFADLVTEMFSSLFPFLPVGRLKLGGLVSICASVLSLHSLTGQEESQRGWRGGKQQNKDQPFHFLLVPFFV